MVARASRTALPRFLLRAAILPALLLLPGCRFFTASFFPGYLSQVEKSWDVESPISTFLAGVGASDYALRPSVFVLTASSGADYGGLLLELDGVPEKLLLMAGPTGGVQVLVSAEFSQLQFTNSYGYFVVGRLCFLPGNLGSPSPSQYSSALSNIDGRAYYDGSTHYRLWTDGTNLLSYQTLTVPAPTGSWSAGSTSTPAIDSAITGFELRGAYYDALAAYPLALVFFNGSMNRVYVIRVPSLPSASTPFTAYYPLVTFEDVDPSRVTYTHKGIVVAQDREAVLMDFNGNETGKRMSLGQGGDKSFAFDIEGDVFYVFDPENKTLYRGKTGW